MAGTEYELTGDFPWNERARGGSRMYTSSVTGNVTRPSQQQPREDDFAALRMAALEELDPKRQARTAVLPQREGTVRVLDTKKLDRATRAELLLSVAEEDTSSNLIMLQKLRARLDKAGISVPKVTVRYRDLSVITTIKIGSTSVPTLINVAKHMVEPVLKLVGKAKKKDSYPIIDSVSGVLRPGVLTLLLGPPGSGKSTMLKTLAGYNRREPGITVKAAELTYNGKQFHEFRVERSSAYISQVDIHYGELTVRETFDFSARCQSAGYRVATLEALQEAERAQGIVPDPEVDAFMKSSIYGKGRDASLSVDITIALLGLDVCADTVVGNAMLRGISGGQKKRVTTGELLVGPARVLFADEISTGLDSNTTFSITKAIGNLAHIMDYTVVVGLLQPSPETYDLFDEVILISNGRVPFHGPLSAVLPFFEALGYHCPVRRGVADFLQEVTTPSDQHKYWDKEKNGGRPFRYTTMQMFLEAYRRQPYWQSMADELAAPWTSETESFAAHGALQIEPYAQRRSELLRANFWRWLTLMIRTKIFVIFRTVQVCLMAFLLSTVFWQAPKDSVEDANLYYGVMFYSLLYQLLGAISEMHLLVDRLAVMLRQRDARFYPGWAFAVPVVVLRLPFCLLEAVLWSVLVYWIVGFATSVRFLQFTWQLFLMNAWSVQMFVLIAAITRNDTIATAVGSFFLLIFINVSGFVLNASDIPPWWLGGFWANPFAYATRSLAINEFTSSDWDKPDTVNGGNLGQNALAFRGFQTDYWWCWVSTGFAIGTFFLNAAVFVAAITYLPAPYSPPTMTQENLADFELSRRILSENAALHAPGVRVVSRSAETGRNGDGEANKSGQAARTLPGESKDEIDVDAAANEHNTAVDGAETLEALEASLPADAALPTRRASSLSVASHRERLNASFTAGAQYKEATALKFHEVVMTFRDVCYSVSLPKDVDPAKANDPGAEGQHVGKLRLLKNIDGVFRPHVLTALMGASGAGKTTLMDVLAGRKTEGLITGDIRINGYPKQDATLARVMGYVEQVDIHLPQSTVLESLEFSAALRLPSTVEEPVRRAFVREIMDLAELGPLRNAFVGTLGESGLSVEQRKRLTLAVELVANPGIVFMDEPTSGLDARAASIVMNAVRNTVDTGRTVVCTIHQPSIDIFQAFDELLLLKPGGRTIYNGPMGDDSAALIAYFEAIPGVEPIKPRYNPANWMLELRKDVDATISEFENPREGIPDIDLAQLSPPGLGVQFRCCLRRNFVQYWRLPEYNITRFASTILIGLVFGTMFWRKGSDRTTVTGVLNIMGVLFSSVVFVGISNCLMVQHVVNTQRIVFYRERAAGLYGVLPFSAAQQLVEIPYLVAQAVVYAAIVYWMIWFQRSAGAFFCFWFYYIDPVSWSLYGLATAQLKDFGDETIIGFDGVEQSIPAFLESYFGYKASMLGPIVAILLAFSACFIGVSVFGFSRLNFQSR
ncbi:hypothetical protein QBZ16_003778 [Prototheca wickerhamii]|uniref:ABC transporter domain-containing protein n=1 Tax=Prototheca wickerhamii TaxID=3111 RepID=A0AAD9MKD5_PROWI|nr:hypothetical protein QBZ16_003778 [Prototheca wickerhamii]